ncbi:phosphotransferase family protein [Antrihabitans stalactiti]|uniref:Phosphotransferase family protein n=1 Tax=Antrihabitans stalactiti TaxID=2584121 RepID=A0A848K8E6_9NOCA|nr:phosphotransferase family protein [Antrihabitans stalactiti]NMN94731.1 phosphotransferase family protein [Antrihabitans stalactiti]
MPVEQPAAVDRDLVDFAILAQWMDGQGLCAGSFDNVAPIGGGTQNVMLRLTRGGREYVLRRGPRHLRRKSNDVIRRESRLLTALNKTDVPAPTLIAACDDETVMGGAVFYLMEPIDGFSPATGLPELHASDPAIRHRMGLSAAAGLAQLGMVDFESIGLAEFGKPEGFLERQVPRWLAELESYNQNQGYPGPDIPGLEHVADWLERHRPEQGRAGILHGDCHLANMMFRNDGPELAALVDWEMSTIGDPLLDLGWLIATWPTGSKLDALVGALASAGGLASPDELVKTYSEHSDRDLSNVNWYVVLACFKLGIVLEGTHARAFAGKAPKEVGDMLHAMTLALFDNASARAE